MPFIDPTLYAGNALPPEVVGTDPATAGSTVAEDPGRIVPFGEMLPQDSPTMREAQAVRENAARPKATMLQSFMASAQLTDTAKVLRAMWDGDEDWDEVSLGPQDSLNDFLANVPEQLSEDERNWIGEGRSVAAWQHRVERIKQLRQYQKVAGDNSLTAFLPHLADPVQFVTGLGIGKVAGLARTTTNMARASAFAAGAAVPLAIEGISTDPHRDEAELALEMLANGVGSAFIVRKGQGPVNKHIDYPDEELQHVTQTNKPKYKLISPAQYVDEVVPGKPKVNIIKPAERDAAGNITTPAVFEEIAQPDTIVRKKVKDAVFEEVPPELAPGVTHVEPGPVVKAIDSLIEKDPPKSWSDRFYWNISRSMQKFSPEVADLLVDNNSALTKNSVGSLRHAVRTDLAQLEHVALDEIRLAMKDQGYGVWRQLRSPKEAAKAQANLMEKVQREMHRQETLFRQGKQITPDGVDPKVWSIADKYNKVHKRALEEMKRAGVEGAENLEYTPGYYSRKYSAYRLEKLVGKLDAAGVDGAKAIKRMVAGSLAKANGWDDLLSYDVAASIINRVQRKGEMKDMLFAVPAGEGQLKMMRDILKEEVAAGGLTQGRMERILDVMRQQSEDAGKQSFLKHRVDLDYEHGININGERIQVSDLLDGRIETSISRYLDRASTQVALADKGIKTTSDITKLREKFISGAKSQDKDKAAELFDNVMNSMMGRPTGEAVNENMRLLAAYNRSITLGMSGVWQIAETATIMGKYGMLKTLKHGSKEMPIFKQMLQNTSKSNARSLQNILAFNAEQHTRLKPFMYRFEDNFDVAADATVQLAAQQVNQLVPYVNGMKHIQSWQARTSAGLVVERLQQAADGVKGARDMLEKYGIQPQVMDRIANQVKLHGMEVDKWDDAVWAQAKPTFGKMMDEAVLHARLGDTPAFVAFDKAGKFIFTYRNFVLTAHNKLFAGGVARDGIGATSLLMLYQMPLAAMAVNASSVLKGKGPLSLEETVQQAGAQLSILGMFTEAWRIGTGNMTSLGNPAMIAADRWIQIAGAASSGDVQRTSALTASAVPLLNVLPFAGAVRESALGD